MELVFFIENLLAATLRMATPLMFGTMGELFCERSGVLNLGIEGTMFMGAFVGFTVAAFTGSLWLGVLAALLAGALAGLLMGFFAVKLGVNQHVSGLGITLLLTSLSLVPVPGDLWGKPDPSEDRTLPAVDFPARGSPDRGYPFPICADLYRHSVSPIVWWVIYRTNFGLDMRAVGENPEAADAAGVNVFRTRYMACDWRRVDGGGRVVPHPGAARFVHFRDHRRARLGVHRADHLRQLDAGPGAVGSAALRRHSGAAAPPANHRLQMPYEAFLALPYIVTIVALAITGRKATGPAAVLKPYRRE